MKKLSLDSLNIFLSNFILLIKILVLCSFAEIVEEVTSTLMWRGPLQNTVLITIGRIGPTQLLIIDPISLQHQMLLMLRFEF